VFLVVAVDQLLEERLSVADLRVHPLGEVDLPRAAAVRADSGLVHADLAEAFAALVEPVVRQREQRVGDADVPVGERRRSRELVDRREHRVRVVQHRADALERLRQPEQLRGLVGVRDQEPVRDHVDGGLDRDLAVVDADRGVLLAEPDGLVTEVLDRVADRFRFLAVV